jgi:hypothetical protein
VIDQNLNIASRDFEVIIRDTLQPYFICRNDTTIAACNGVVNYEVPTVVDNCPQGAVLTQIALGPGASFPIGTTTETYSYVSNRGSERITCSFDITVEKIINAEVTARDVRCPGDQNGSATVEIDQSSQDFDFEWSDGQTTQTAINLGPGAYSVTVEDGVECRFVKEVFIGEPVELSIRIDSIKAPDDRGDVYITPMGGTAPYQYNWQSDAGTVSTVQDPQNLDFGSYDLLLTDANGCQLNTTVKVDETTPVHESDFSRYLKISPNPTSGIFTVEFPSGSESVAQVKLSSLTGRKLYETQVKTSQPSEIDPGNLPGGVYLVSIWTSSDRTTKRLIIR